MPNIRENRKSARIQKLKMIIEKSGGQFDREKLISLMIVENAVSRKTAIEEIDAVLNYMEK